MGGLALTFDAPSLACLTRLPADVWRRHFLGELFAYPVWEDRKKRLVLPLPCKKSGRCRSLVLHARTLHICARLPENRKGYGTFLMGCPARQHMLCRRRRQPVRCFYNLSSSVQCPEKSKAVFQPRQVCCFIRVRLAMLPSSGRNGVTERIDMPVSIWCVVNTLR